MAGNSTRTITEFSANDTVTPSRSLSKTRTAKPGRRAITSIIGSGLVLVENETKTTNGSGAQVETVTDYAAMARNRPDRDDHQRNGLVTTTQVDPSGAGVFDFTATSTTVENANGSSTVTQAETAANGSLIGETVTTTSANGLYHNAERQTGNGAIFDTTVTDNTADNTNGSVTETITTTSDNGTLLGEQIINTSADRSTVTITTENGDGQTVQAETTVTAPNGVTTDTLADYAQNGSLVNETVTTTSANGLDITTQTDNTGDGTFDTTTTDNTVINANGSRTETVTTTSASSFQRTSL